MADPFDFDLAQAVTFLRTIAGQTKPLSTMQGLDALDHAIALEAEAERRRAERITIPDSERIDPYRCDLGNGHHVLRNGSVA